MVRPPDNPSPSGSAAQRGPHGVGRDTLEDRVTLLPEDPLPLVLPEDVGPEVVALEQVHVPVAVHVVREADVGVLGTGDPPLLALLGELEVALVDEEVVVPTIVGLDQVVALAAGLLMAVGAHEEVQQAVPIGVEGHDCLQGHPTHPQG